MKKPKHYVNQPEYLIPYGHWVSVDLRPEGEFFPSELNDALLIDEAYNSGVTFKHSRITSDGYAVSVMDMTIPHGLKLGEVFDRVPYGIAVCTYTQITAYHILEAYEDFELLKYGGLSGGPVYSKDGIYGILVADVFLPSEYILKHFPQ